MKNKKVELLAPAGDLNKLKWAVDYGCNAVYVGGVNYSLRANAKNFTIDDLKEAVAYCHSHNARLYVTVNIVFHNEDVEGLEDYLIKLDQIGVDAIIFSDPLVIDIVKKNKLKFELHLSTQASVLNKDAAKYYEQQGVKRVVLARECSRDDIKNIIDSTNLDIECFIHGAMCTNISGRCVLSNYFTNRDANRGGCCQVCRFNFNLYDKDKNQISETDNFSIAPKDLSMVNYIKDMMDIGIKSFKLEGRMRSIYYVSTIVSCYRKLIDMYEENTYDQKLVNNVTKALYRCANRDVAPQFYNKKPSHEEQYYGQRKEDSNQDFLGVVLGYDNHNKEVIIEQRNYFKPGDNVIIFGPNKEYISLTINNIKNEDNEELDAARHPGEIVRINCDIEVNKNDLMCVNFLD